MSAQNREQKRRQRTKQPQIELWHVTGRSLREDPVVDLPLNRDPSDHSRHHAAPDRAQQSNRASEEESLENAR